MTKTELRRKNIKAVITLLKETFQAYNIEDSEGGRIMFQIDTPIGKTFTGEFSRSDFDVCFYEKEATNVEIEINKRISEVLLYFQPIN